MIEAQALRRGLAAKGYDLGKVPPESSKRPAPSVADLCARVNSLVISHVQEYPRSYPIHHYIDTLAQARTTPVFNAVHGNTCAILLHTLLTEEAPPFPKDLSVRKQQEYCALIAAVRDTMRGEIEDEDIIKEMTAVLEQLEHRAHKAEKMETLATLFHPADEVRRWRILVRGRSWFPPKLYSLLFMMNHQPVQLPWTTLPCAILDGTRVGSPTDVPVHLWPILCKHVEGLSSEPTNACTRYIYGIDNHPLQVPQFLTIYLAGTLWKQCWTQCAWPCRRSVVKRVVAWQHDHPLEASQLEDIVQECILKRGGGFFT